MRLSCKFPVLSALLVLLVAGASSAATYRVPSEYATINEALGVSAFGDTVLVAPGTYTDWEHEEGLGNGSSSAAFLVDGVVLRSEGGSGVTIIDMQGQSIGFPYVIRAKDLASDATTVEGFTVRGVPYPGNGVGVFDCGKVTIRDCRFADVGAQAPGTGGSTIRSRYSDIEVVDCSFENCSASAGGAIGQLVGDVVISGCEFIGCSSSAVYLDGDPDPFHSAEITGCSFLGNESSFGGPALLSSYYAGGLTIAACHFESNASTGTTGSGGAVRLIDFTRPIAITDCVFVNNRLEGFGHGGTVSIGLTSGAIEISRNTFYGSSQDNAFGGSTVDLLGHPDVAFANNLLASSTSGQAVVYAPEANVSSSCNVFWDNEAPPAHGFELDPTDRVIDPLFCDPETGDLTVSSESPCLPANSLGCGLIGALGQGCGVVSIAPRSWGSIKSMYR